MPFLGNKDSRDQAQLEMQRRLDRDRAELESLDIRKPVTDGFGFDQRPGADNLAGESRRTHYRRGKDGQLLRISYAFGCEVVQSLGMLGLRGTMLTNGERLSRIPKEYDPDEAPGTVYEIDTPDGAA